MKVNISDVIDAFQKAMIERSNPSSTAESMEETDSHAQDILSEYIGNIVIERILDLGGPLS